MRALSRLIAPANRMLNSVGFRFCPSDNKGSTQLYIEAANMLARDFVKMLGGKEK